ncbi:lysophospholipid acyltransferase family protein [Chitinispirillales bacterium ANBcel5]|uniref:lysophospholipid acyltransferase family protein n=1 Tax=Cellulosispirillum alkaliphilum TaxID=3039283 RepID=UPI002A5358BC|nr:lysophospholipid acyltransferase family protein [Chitinispirillales bacterium ANBcel5]
MKLKEKLRHWTMWNVISKTFILFSLKKRYRFNKHPSSFRFPKPPFLVVSNHGTFFDPWFIGFYSIKPFYLMINDDAFRVGKITSWYLRNVGTIPKKKGSSDFKAMKLTLKRLKERDAVCIFPEGQTTWDGETQPIYKGIEKIAKRARCPVVLVRLKGNFLMKPWWAESLRKGRVHIDFKTLSAQEIESMSEERLLSIIQKSIYQNDVKDPDNQKAPFSGNNLALGLQNFVWNCVHCNSEDMLEVSGSTVTCSHCNKSWLMDAHCGFTEQGKSTPAFDLYDWSLKHKEMVKGKIAAATDNELLTQSSAIEMQTFNSENDDFEIVLKSGNAKLTPKTLSITDGDKEYSWPVNAISDFVIQRKNIFEFCHKNEVIRFAFSNKSPMKWVTYLRYLHGYEEYEKKGHI